MVICIIIILFAVYTGSGLQLGVIKGELSERGAYTSAWNLTFMRVQKALKKTTNDYDINLLLKAKRLCLLRWGIFVFFLILFILHVGKKI
jgi:hypothetical protein